MPPSRDPYNRPSKPEPSHHAMLRRLFRLGYAGGNRPYRGEPASADQWKREMAVKLRKMHD